MYAALLQEKLTALKEGGKDAEEADADEEEED